MALQCIKLLSSQSIPNLPFHLPIKFARKYVRHYVLEKMTSLRDTNTSLAQNILGHDFQDTSLLWEALQVAGSGIYMVQGRNGQRLIPVGNKRLAVYGDAAIANALSRSWFWTGASQGISDTTILRTCICLLLSRRMDCTAGKCAWKRQPCTRRRELWSCYAYECQPVQPGSTLHETGRYPRRSSPRCSRHGRWHGSLENRNGQYRSC